jgi:hypothetical protein
MVRDGTQLPPVDVLTMRGLPLRVVAVHESLLAGEPYAVFVAAQHPYQERIDLDEVIDRLSAVEPPADEELLLTVVKQDHDVVLKEDGYRLVTRYRVVTNEAGRYQITPTATKIQSYPAQVDSFLHGDANRSLPEGVTIITVDHVVRIGGHVVFEIEDVRDDSEEVVVDFDLVRDDSEETVFARTIDNASGRTRSAADARESEGRAADPATGTGFDPGHLHVKVPFHFGIEVASVSDPEVVARASFGFIRP